MSNKLKKLTNELKQSIKGCVHSYKYFPEKINGLLERKVRGVCLFCGEQKELSVEEYHKILKSQTIQTNESKESH